jgi:hypothetical protein
MTECGFTLVVRENADGLHTLHMARQGDTHILISLERCFINIIYSEKEYYYDE